MAKTRVFSRNSAQQKRVKKCPRQRSKKDGEEICCVAAPCSAKILIYKGEKE